MADVATLGLEVRSDQVERGLQAAVILRSRQISMIRAQSPLLPMGILRGTRSFGDCSNSHGDR